jgi:hypothetical protein
MRTLWRMVTNVDLMLHCCQVVSPLFICIGGILMCPKREGFLFFVAGLLDVTGFSVALVGAFQEQKTAESQS